VGDHLSASPSPSGPPQEPDPADDRLLKALPPFPAGTPHRSMLTPARVLALFAVTFGTMAVASAMTASRWSGPLVHACPDSVAQVAAAATSTGLVTVDADTVRALGFGNDPDMYVRTVAAGRCDVEYLAATVTVPPAGSAATLGDEGWEITSRAPLQAERTIDGRRWQFQQGSGRSADGTWPVTLGPLSVER
jgi:hypothetical protein